MSYKILEENSKTVLVRMPRSYLARLETKPTRKRVFRDDEMTPENMIQYIRAQEDLKNGVNIVSGEDFVRKFALK